MYVSRLLVSSWVILFFYEDLSYRCFFLMLISVDGSLPQAACSSVSLDALEPLLISLAGSESCPDQSCPTFYIFELLDISNFDGS